MAITNPQKSLLKRAQRQAGLGDDEYRESLQLISGCRSSTDPAMTDRHLDKMLAYLEAIFFRRVALGELEPSRSLNAVFRQPGYWASRNTAQETSRDRFNGREVQERISELEKQLAAFGFGERYFTSIRQKVTHGQQSAHALHCYCNALARTLQSKRRKLAAALPNKSFSG